MGRKNKENKKKDDDDDFEIGDVDLGGGLENKAFEDDSMSRTSTYKPSIRDKFRRRMNKMKEEKEQGVSIRELFKYADGLDKFLMLLGFCASLGSAAIYPLLFYLFGEVAATFLDRDKQDIINSTNITNPCFVLTKPDETDFDERLQDSIYLYVAFGFTSITLCYIAFAAFNTSAERQTKRVRELLFSSMIRQEMAFFDRNSPGDLSARITGNIDTYKAGIGFKIGDFISLIGRGIGCVIYAMIAAWKFSIVFLGLFPFVSILTACLVVFAKKYTQKEFEAYGKAGKVAQEVLSSLRTVLAFGGMRKEVHRYGENLGEAERLSSKKGLVTGLFTGIALGLFNCMFAIGLYYGNYLNTTECLEYTPDNILRSLTLMITATFALGQGMPFLRDLAESRGAAKTIFEIIDKQSEIDIKDKVDKQTLDNLKGEITFDQVEFSYPQRANLRILNKLSLRMPANKTIALCGSSGCGKSTTIQLIQRFYNISGGSIKLDGVDITQLDLEWLRNQIAVVSQEPVLFSTSIKENIRLGRMEASDEEIESAAKMANAHGFISKLADKYDTQVGERGGQLSGGQKQRIAIARAILRNPRILLLDEATSALDYESEKIVQEALDKAKEGRTTIVIAHRLSTIRNADLIVGMHKGEVQEMGSHEELMRKKGIYYELVMSQTAEANKEKQQRLERLKSQVSVVATKRPKRQESEAVASIKRQKSTKNNGIDIDMNSIDSLDSDEQDVEEVKRESIFKLAWRNWYYHRPEWAYLIMASVAQLVAGAVNPALSFVFTEIYNIFIIQDNDEREQEALKYMGILFGIAVANVFGILLANYGFTLVGARLTKRLRLRMFESMLRQEIAYHDLDENKSSVLATRLAAAVPFCKGLTSDFLNLVCQAAASVGFSIILGFVLNWKLTLVIMTFIPLAFLTGLSNVNFAQNKSSKRSNEEEGGRLATEVIENIKTVVSLGKEMYFYDMFADIFNQRFKRVLCMIHPQGILYGISNSILFFIQATTFSFGNELIKDGELNTTDMFRIYSSITFSAMSLGRLFAQLPDTKKARDASETAHAIINRQSAIDSMSEDGQRPDTVKGEIKFVNVKFRYPNRPNVTILNGFTLTCPPGKVNALVGGSGCGKSTTIALLQRFYDVEEGHVELDGVDIRDLNIQWLRSKIGIVSQEPVLFSFTIRENICYGRVDDESIGIDEVMRVAKDANISQRIEALPDKYETEVGTKGSQLSGGEKQRIAIARALIRKPTILLLDEATSALDNQSEHIVQDALDRAQAGRTCIVIAHRLSTIQNADKITVVKDGVVMEEGAHNQLMKNKSFYYSLQTQNQANK